MATDYKVGSPEPEDREWAYGNAWATEETTGGGNRLVIAPAYRQTEILGALLKDMTGPFWLLYVLVIPRGRAESGRYQSPEPQTQGAVEAFLNEFSSFLEKDGRHNVWIASESGSEMLIYDRHNVIYAYGPLPLGGGHSQSTDSAKYQTSASHLRTHITTTRASIWKKTA